MYHGSILIAANFALSVQNYTGAQFATELALNLNYAALTLSPLLVFDCVYDLAENMHGITLSDTRDEALKAPTPFKLENLTDETLSAGSNRIADPRTINTIIRNTTQTFITEAAPYTCYLDMFQTRNFRFTSSAVASYDTVSDFGVDTIIKKILCTVGYNKLLTQSSGSTLDGLDVSKRTLRFIDFKLVDSSFRTIPLQGNHFSFIIIFTQALVFKAHTI